MQGRLLSIPIDGTSKDVAYARNTESGCKTSGMVYKAKV